MKRSNMIKIILDCIDTYNPDCDMEFGDFILTHIEKAGMLPPRTKIEYGGNISFEDNCWERED